MTGSATSAGRGETGMLARNTRGVVSRIPPAKLPVMVILRGNQRIPPLPRPLPPLRIRSSFIKCQHAATALTWPTPAFGSRLVRRISANALRIGRPSTRLLSMVSTPCKSNRNPIPPCGPATRQLTRDFGSLAATAISRASRQDRPTPMTVGGNILCDGQHRGVRKQDPAPRVQGGGQITERKSAAPMIQYPG